MSDEIENPFGISLLKEKLRIRMTTGNEMTGNRLSLQAPRLDVRSTTATSRGLALRLRERPALEISGGDKLNRKTLSHPATFLRELAALQVRGMFAMKRPANVNAEDLTENDNTYRGRGAVMAKFVSRTAQRFGIHPGLLAEHLAAEYAFANIAQVPANASLLEYLKVKTITTAQLGLDDFVSNRKLIESMIPAARAIGRGRPSNPIIAESELRKAIERGATQEEIDKLMKPQLSFPLGDGIAAAAAYLRFKTEAAKNHIPDFATLPREVQFQLVRLYVNPPSGKKNPKGINFINREANAGRYMGLFDFSDRTAHEANDPTKATDVFRRATIHTARAIHLDDDVLQSK